jgi:hypothetical protein
MKVLKRVYRLSMIMFICALIPWGYVIESGQRQPDDRHPHEIHAKSRPRYVSTENKGVYDFASVILVLSLVVMAGSRFAIYRIEKKETGRVDG